MSQFAFLIAAHNRGDQLALLIDRLLTSDSNDYVILHIDQRSQLWKEERDRFVDHPTKRLHLIADPIPVFWAHSSIVHAERLLLSEALARGFDLAHLLSGADWPVSSRQAIVDRLNADNIRNCYLQTIGPVQTDRMQDYWLPNTINDRLGSDIGRYRLNRIMSGTARILTTLNEIYGRERTHPYGSPWLKGSQWWSIPRDVAEYVVEQLGSPAIINRLRATSCSDEHVIQTMIARRYPDRLNEYMRYISWPENSNHPHTLGAADISSILESEAWFARKFDMETDASFLTAFPRFE